MPLLLESHAGRECEGPFFRAPVVSSHNRTEPRLEPARDPVEAEKRVGDGLAVRTKPQAPWPLLHGSPRSFLARTGHCGRSSVPYSENHGLADGFQPLSTVFDKYIHFNQLRARSDSISTARPRPRQTPAASFSPETSGKFLVPVMPWNMSSKLTSKSKTPRFSNSPFFRIVHEAFPILASGHPPETNKDLGKRSRSRFSRHRSLPR